MSQSLPRPLPTTPENSSVSEVVSPEQLTKSRKATPEELQRIAVESARQQLVEIGSVEGVNNAPANSQAAYMDTISGDTAAPEAVNAQYAEVPSDVAVINTALNAGASLEKIRQLEALKAGDYAFAA
jgi:hypothetical protein